MKEMVLIFGPVLYKKLSNKSSSLREDALYITDKHSQHYEPFSFQQVLPILISEVF